MASSNPISEQELEDAFRDDPDFAIRILHSEFRNQIARYIKSKLVGLPPGQLPEAIKDVYQETMVALIPLVRSTEFDSSSPLRIVFTLAARKAVDYLRRRKYRPKQDIDGAIDQIAKDLASTRIGLRWRLLDQITWQEFRKALLEAVTTVLTPKQAIVARCFIDHYEDFRDHDVYVPLARLVGEITGEVENVVTVKKTWQDAKARLVEELTSKGFNFLATEK
ncbi:MAG: hypothetical protein U0996_21970 [Planctomycetaceae bacterium]